MVIGPPDWICFLNKGMTEPLEHQYITKPGRDKGRMEFVLDFKMIIERLHIDLGDALGTPITFVGFTRFGRWRS